jgi:predicted ATPase
MRWVCWQDAFNGSPHIKVCNDPTQVKGRAFVVSRDLINSVRQENTVVLLLEDMQWTDFASWEYLMEVFLRETNPNLPNGIFILGAARPEWHPPEELTVLLESSTAGQISSGKWGSSIRLAPLTSQETRELAMEILQRVVDVPEQVIELLVERSEGVPYFTEEIVNWFIDHEILDTHSEQWRFVPEKLKSQPLPSTLQHLLFTRLSSLSQPERAALQRGSIFGRRFWTGGVEALGVVSGEETLGHLEPRGFVQAQPDSVFEGDTEWSFHHNLLQEVT